MDNKILTTLIDKFKGGPVGITTLATAVSENGETIEEVYEPFLIQEGFLVRTPRGREVTELALPSPRKDQGQSGRIVLIHSIQFLLICGLISSRFYP